LPNYNSRRDFIPGTIKKCNIAVMGIGGKLKCKIKGTASWTADQGCSHDIIIPDTPMKRSSSSTDSRCFEREDV
jgi:hypothetical protein